MQYKGCSIGDAPLHVPPRRGAYLLLTCPCTCLLAYQVRTEPLLRDLRDEVVDSCEYAFQADHVSTHGGLELLAESGAAPRGGGGGGGVLVLGATAAVLLAAHRRTVL